MALLEKINSPADLKNISRDDLPELAEEIRLEIVDVVSQTGGHLAPSLGVVELTIAIHYVFDAPHDRHGRSDAVALRELGFRHW